MALSPPPVLLRPVVPVLVGLLLCHRVAGTREGSAARRGEARRAGSCAEAGFTAGAAWLWRERGWEATACPDVIDVIGLPFVPGAQLRPGGDKGVAAIRGGVEEIA